ASIYYEPSGEGPPLVFAHGAGGNTLVWWQQVPHFARRYRVLTFDHRGFGRSACEPGAETAPHFAGDLAAVLDDAGIDRAALVCQSMGGWTGLQLARAMPARAPALGLRPPPAGIKTPRGGRALLALARAVPQGDRAPAGNDPPPALAADISPRAPPRGFLYAQRAALNPPIELARRGLQEIN